MADDRARAHPVCLHGGGQRDLHGEQRRLDPVDTGHDLAAPTSPRSPRTGLRGDQRLGSRDGRGEHRLVGQQVSAHRRPLRTLPGEHPHRTPVVAARPRPDTEYRRRRPRATPRSARRGCWRSRRCAPGGAHADAPGCRPDPATRRPSCASHPVGQPAGGAAQFVGRGGRQREKQWCRRADSAAIWPRCAAASGACSRTACTLVPENPYDDTAARAGCVTVGGPRRDSLAAQRVWSRSGPAHRAAG